MINWENHIIVQITNTQDIQPIKKRQSQIVKDNKCVIYRRDINIQQRYEKLLNLPSNLRNVN